MSCGFGETNPSSHKINKSLFCLDSLSKVFPDYELEYSEDSTVYFLKNYYKDRVLREYLSFDSAGNYKAFVMRHDNVDIYRAWYDDSLNVIEEMGSLYHLTMIDCYKKESSTLFRINPVTPPFFSSNFFSFFSGSTCGWWTKKRTKEKPMLLAPLSFLDRAMGLPRRPSFSSSLEGVVERRRVAATADDGELAEGEEEEQKEGAAASAEAAAPDVAADECECAWCTAWAWCGFHHSWWCTPSPGARC
mgnify:CR=1 FL=1